MSSCPRVVIVGAGFGGLEAARALRDAPVRVTVIDQTNHHVFQPLLYQVATAELSPADISAPIRGVLRHQRNAEVLLGKVTGVDVVRRVVEIGDRETPYDMLALATGAGQSYFGHDEWARYAPGLKTTSDATAIRQRILLAFEAAEMERDPEAQHERWSAARCMISRRLASSSCTMDMSWCAIPSACRSWLPSA
jgi:NADH dehydrogenase